MRAYNSKASAASSDFLVVGALALYACLVTEPRTKPNIRFWCELHASAELKGFVVAQGLIKHGTFQGLTHIGLAASGVIKQDSARLHL